MQCILVRCRESEIAQRTPTTFVVVKVKMCWFFSLFSVTNYLYANEQLTQSASDTQSNETMQMKSGLC